MKEPVDHYIYFIYCKLTNLVKIGYSKRLMARAEEIRGCSSTLLFPLALELIPSGVPARVYEANLHAKFSLYKRCSRPNDEWFYYTPEIEEYVKALPVLSLLQSFQAFLSYSGEMTIVQAKTVDSSSPSMDRKFHNVKREAKDRWKRRSRQY